MKMIKLKGLLYFLELETERKLEQQYIIEQVDWRGRALAYARDRLLYEKRNLIKLRKTYQIATEIFYKITT